MEPKPLSDPRDAWPALPLSSAEVQVDLRDGRWRIWCAVRAKWVLLEPEEWVRQHVVQALVQSGWPVARMQLELPVRFGAVDGRVDIACFDRSGNVALAAEVKAPDVPLDQRVADQLARYDLALACPWLLMSNGLRTAAWRREGDGRRVPHRGWPTPEG